MKTMIILKRLAALLVLAMLMPPALALDSIEQDLLKPDQAFRFSAELVDPATIRVTWDIADGYYLYRDRIRFSTDTPGIELRDAVLPAGKIKDDEFFGKLAIYRKQAVVTIPVTRSNDAPATLKLSAVSQGCADIGVCFPPHTQLAELALPASSPAASDTPQSLGDTLGLGVAGDEQFLDADEAFRVSVTPERPDLLLVRWDIADGYYLLQTVLGDVQIASELVSCSGADCPVLATVEADITIAAGIPLFETSPKTTIVDFSPRRSTS